MYEENVNGEHYLEILQTKIVPTITNRIPHENNGNHINKDVWYQQDVAAHYDVRFCQYLN